MITQKQQQQIIKIAKNLGKIIADSYKNRDNLTMEYKSDGCDFVTEIDKQVEKTFITEIAKIFPNANVLGEEFGYQDTFSRENLLFVIDPIDGTKYFRYGISLFALSIGILCKDIPIWGLILNPVTDDIIYGGKDFGVYNQFGKIEKSHFSTLHETQVYYDTAGRDKATKQVIRKGDAFILNLMNASYRVRTAGASCMFAFGAASGMIGALLDVYGGVKITDRVGYSAILQGLNWEERMIIVENTTLLWLGPSVLLDEIQTIYGN